MATTNSILGKKVGMTQIFDEKGTRIGVTVIQAGPCKVLQVKTKESDGYNAIQLGIGDKKEKNTSKPLLGHFDKAGSSPKRFIREVRVDDTPETAVGDDITVDIFEGVRKIDVVGTSKGKGFAGTIKRWNFHMQPASHGNSKNHRTSGGLGRQMSVNKGVPKGKKMAGHLGCERITIQGLKIVRADPEHNLLLVQGSVPGANGSYLVIKKSIQEKVRQDKEERQV